MNYYERFLGDYGRDTGHLTLAQHGAYTLLLDAYYSTEGPLPADLPTLHRICRAMTKAEQEAVKVVAEQFFPLGEDGLRHNLRADVEIPKALARINTSRANGKKGGRKPRDNPPGYTEEPNRKPSGLNPGSPDETCAGVHHTPDPNPTITESGTHPSSTPGGRVCARIRQAGIGDANPMHPRLTTLLRAGVPEDEFATAAEELRGTGKGFAYLLGMVEGRRRDLAQGEKVPEIAPKAPDVCCCCEDLATKRIGRDWYCQTHDQFSDKRIVANA